MVTLPFTAFLVAGVLAVPSQSKDCSLPEKKGLRFATFNTSLNRPKQGQLIDELKMGKSIAAQRIAEVVSHVNPDVLLLQEVDQSSDQQTLEVLYQKYLRPQLSSGHQGFPYRHHFSSNTGLTTPYDLDRNGKLNGPGDAQGFGFHPGQYAFALLSKVPFEKSQLRSFQTMLWKDFPGHHLDDIRTSTEPWYSDEVRRILRLSSKNHIAVPLQYKQQTVWILAAHPTPPVFDGAEDRNGWRNFDEIGLIKSLVVGQSLRSDQGQMFQIPTNDSFVVLGDLNADPSRGDGQTGAIQQLLDSSRVHQRTARGDLVPSSNSAVDDAKYDTATFGLRVDYVLPSNTMNVYASGICRAPTVNDKPITDHHLVWVDAEPKQRTQP